MSCREAIGGVTDDLLVKAAGSFIQSNLGRIMQPDLLRDTTSVTAPLLLIGRTLTRDRRIHLPACLLAQAHLHAPKIAFWRRLFPRRRCLVDSARPCLRLHIQTPPFTCRRWCAIWAGVSTTHSQRWSPWSCPDCSSALSKVAQPRPEFRVLIRVERASPLQLARSLALRAGLPGTSSSREPRLKLPLPQPPGWVAPRVQAPVSLPPPWCCLVEICRSLSSRPRIAGTPMRRMWPPDDDAAVCKV